MYNCNIPNKLTVGTWLSAHKQRVAIDLEYIRSHCEYNKYPNSITKKEIKFLICNKYLYITSLIHQHK